MTIELIETRDKLIVSDDGNELIQVITQGEQGVGIDPGDKGVITIPANLIDWTLNDNVITSSKIVDGTIVNADINANAAIALTKLATGALPTAITVTSANISDLSIVDADINASAAIAGTKISPDFGSQNIVTTGTAATGALGVTGNLTVSGTVDGVDIATRDALFGGLTSSSGVLSNGVTATTQSASDNSTKVATTAYTDTAISNLINGSPGALDTLNELAAALNDDAAFSTTVTNSIATKMPLAGGQFTGNVTFSGTQTVDGRDLSVDGAKLDGIESGATADQTAAEIRTLVESASDSNVFTDADHSKLNGIEASATADQTAAEIKTLFNSNGLVNAQIDASAAIAGTKISPNFGSQNIQTTGGISNAQYVNLSSTSPSIDFVDTNNNSDFMLQNANGVFKLYDSTNSADRWTVASDGTFDINGNLDANAGLDVTGNITVTGTVDGRDVATDGTKLDGIETGATADQTKSDIDALGIAASTATTLANARTIAGTSFDGSANIDISYTNLTDKLSVGDGGLTQNNFTDALKTKLDGIEASATADQTAAEIKTLLNSNGIVNAQVDASAAIAGTKISPNFGSQNLTAANATLSNLDISSTNPYITFTDTDNNSDFGIYGSSGLLKIYDNTNSANRLTIASDGTVNVLNNLDVGAGVDVTGNITATGSLSISSAAPEIFLTDTNADSDYSIVVNTGQFRIRDETNSANRLAVNSDGHVDIYGRLDAIGGLDVTGNITVTGTVDGVDIATRDTLFGGLTSSSGVLSNGVTATTQSASDNSTKVATTAYADTAVANLVDSAPGTLNTLNELAAALGDDPNFATTVTNSIATKLPLAGGQITGNITCSGSQTFDGRDLSVDGTKLDGIESNATADQTASEIVALVADQTIAPSTIDMEDSEKIQLGTGDDLQISHDGTASYIDNYTGVLNVRSIGSGANVQIIADSDYMARFVNDGAVELYYDNSKKFETTSAGVNIPDNAKLGLGSHPSAGGDLLIWHNGSDNFIDTRWNLTIRKDDGAETLAKFNNNASVDLYYDNSKKFETTSSGISVTGEVSTTGHIRVPDNMSLIAGTGSDLFIFHDGNNSKISHVGTGGLYIGADTFALQTGGHGENYISMAANGAVELYYDNSKKLETTSAGATVTGTLVSDGLTIGDSDELRIGDSTDFSIYHSTDTTLSNITGDLKIYNVGTNSDDILVRAKDDIRLEVQSGDTAIACIGDGQVELYYDNSKKLETTSTGATVTGALATTSLSATGGITGTGGNFILGDSSGTSNNRIKLGASGDLQIYHDGSNSIISEQGTGDLTINATSLNLYNNDLGGAYATFASNGAVELFHAGSKKFETKSYGSLWTGQLAGLDNAKVTFGNGDDLQIYHDGSNSHIQEGGTGSLLIKSDAVNLGTVSGEYYFRGFENGGVQLRYDNSTKLETTSTGATVSGTNFTIQDTGSVTLSLTADTDNNNETHCPTIAFNQDGGVNVMKVGVEGDVGNTFTGSTANTPYIITTTGHGGTNLEFGTNNVKRMTLKHTALVPASNATYDLGETNNKWREIYVENFYTTATGFDATGTEFKFHDTDNVEVIINADTDNSNEAHHPNLSFRQDGAVECLQIGIQGDTPVMTGGTHNYCHIAQGGHANTGIEFGTSGSTQSPIKRLTLNSSGHLIPNGNNTYDLGNSGNRFRDIYVANDIDLPDDGMLKLGNSDDLQIYHDGSNSFIKDTGTGNLKVLTNKLELLNAANNEYLAVATENAAVELYYDGSKKLETISGGVLTHGNSYVNDNNKFIAGSGNDLQIYHDGNNSFIKDAGTGRLSIVTSQLQLTNAADSEVMIKATQDDAVELYYNGSKKLETISSGVQVNGDLLCTSNVKVYDNYSLLAGSGNDLQLSHDATNSHVYNTTGELRVRSDDLRLMNAAGNEHYVVGFANSYAAMYYDNSKKFETTTDGVQVTGKFKSNAAYNVVGAEIIGGASGYSEPLIVKTANGDVKFTVDGDGKCGIGTSSPAQLLHLYKSSGDAYIRVQGGTNQGTLIHATDGTLIGGFVSGGSVGGGSSDIAMRAESGNNMLFSHGTTERLRIASDGNVGIGKSSSSLDVDGSIFIGSGQGMNMVKSGSGGKIITLNRRTNVGLSIEFYRGSSVGSISHNNTSTAFNTTSDYRLKENVVLLSDAITRLKTLKPYRFNFIADKDVTVDGFIAHEVTAVPEAIQGEKDAVVTQAMVDNNEYEEDRLGEIIPQGIDQSKLVPLLVAAVQELIGRVEKLEGA